MFDLKKVGLALYLLPPEGGMRVPGLVVATEELLREEEMKQALEQVRNVAYLPGIVGYSIAMPDIHWGYGFPIGGVAAMEIETGVISPGGVGYDINCGVRLALLPERLDNFSPSIKHKLLQTIFQKVPSGVGFGHKSSKGLSDRDYQELAEKGAAYSVELGYGFAQDLEHTESKGVIEGADLQLISSHAKERGRNQLGTLGSGNHFIEIGEVEKILLPDIAKAWGVEEKQCYLLIHTGSRGFGHQICQDTLNEFMKKGFAKDLPDKQLVAAPIQSQEGKNYFSAMAVAANFAFNNRQQILHQVRNAFFEVCGIAKEEIRLVYDVAHNIAKFETHPVNGTLRKLCIHRKGATRSFGPGAIELPPLYRTTGQPVIVPGDMGRASFLLAGLGNETTWSSCCHGAGRAKSRIASSKDWKGRDLKEHMKKQGVEVMAVCYKTIAEEMPDAYKDVCQVVDAVEQAGLARIVAKLRPHLVIKG
jgi:tRNA-splicing ligase RtcB (3'-phosphate/5'-hydroxy nucleic acid ligase)